MILIHMCCADCALKMFDYLGKTKVISKEDVHGYFYNPNIHPQSEYTARQMALQKIALENSFRLIIANWTPKDYFSAILSLPQEQRRDGKYRCPRCWAVRLEQTFRYAKEHEYSLVSTTMLTSHYMDRAYIEGIGSNLSKKYGIDFFVPGSNYGCEIHTSGFYKQNYCGCIYSLEARLEEKYSKNSDTQVS